MSKAAEALQARLEEGFARAFGCSAEGTVRAPGRINLIGEHTDYNDGFALPMAIDHETRIAWRRTGGGTIEVVALDQGEERDRFDAGCTPEPTKTWRDYVRGSVAVLLEAGWEVPGVELAIAGTVPQGSGLSSSAALEIATMHAVFAAAGAALPTPRDVALLAQRAENRFVGVQCGVLDQLAIASGREGAALLIDCRSLATEPVDLPAGIAVLMVESGVQRGLVEGAYNRRREECAAAARTLGVASLRDADAGLLERHAAGLDPILQRRAEHVIGENARVGQFAEALRHGRLEDAGRLLAQSHASLRDLYEVSHPQVDRLVEVLQAAIGSRGGARMTGGGFGGAVVALVDEDSIEPVRRAVRAHYRRPDGNLAEVVRVRPSAGAGPLAPQSP